MIDEETAEPSIECAAVVRIDLSIVSELDLLAASRALGIGLFQSLLRPEIAARILGITRLDGLQMLAFQRGTLILKREQALQLLLLADLRGLCLLLDQRLLHLHAIKRDLILRIGLLACDCELRRAGVTRCLRSLCRALGISLRQRRKCYADLRRAAA